MGGRKSTSPIILLERSLAIDPNQYIARYLLGKTLFQEGKFSLCLHEMLKASKVSFTDASPNLFVTAVFEKIHHWKNARLNLINLKKKQPDSIFLLPLEYSIIKGAGKKTALPAIEDKITRELGFKPSEEKMKLLNNLILESPTPKDMLVNIRQRVKELSVSD